jgi:hypothetical protein
MDDPSGAAREAEQLHLLLLRMRDDVTAARAWRRNRLRVALASVDIDVVPSSELEATWDTLDSWDRMDDEALAALDERLEWSAALAGDLRREARRDREG